MGVMFVILAACKGGPGTIGESSGIVGSGDRDDDDDDDRPPTPATPPTQPQNTQTISAAEYEKACEVDEDCVAIFQGLVCEACQCENETIARREEQKYKGDLARKRGAPPCPSTEQQCAPCEPFKVGCDPSTKRCGVNVTSNDAG